MDVSYRIDLLGGLRLLQGEQVHSQFRTHKAASLLAYLAFHMQEAHSREALVDLLWPDMDIENGRNNLSTALSHLRSRLEPTGVPAGSVLITDRFSVRLNSRVVSTDVAEFQRLFDNAKVSDSIEYRISTRKRAASLYRNVLLPGFTDEWVVEEQIEMERLLVEMLHGLGEDLEESERWAEAVEVTQRTTRIDPYDQQAYQAQMRLYARLGRTSAALKTYRKAEDFLRKEMSASLSAATHQLAEMIEHDPLAFTSGGKIDAKASPKTGASRFTRKPLVRPENALPRLPSQTTPCFGRDHEMEALNQSLREPTTRLVTLLGPGGVGKTRLAVEVAQNIAPMFANRVWFIELASLAQTHLIPAALASALGLSDPSHDALEGVIDYLGEQPCLLVLDNCEHLIRGAGAGTQGPARNNGAAILTRLLLERVPGLVCLATSQAALNIPPEIKVPIQPFAILNPEEAADVETARQNHSIQLFEQFRQAKYPFQITEDNLPHVAQICRFTDGIPLFIQLAAQRREKLPAIAESMAHFFETEGEESVRPAYRHQTEWDCIVWSHSLLTPDAKVLLRRLSVLAGEWDLSISRTICDIGLDTAYHGLLEELCDCSLVHRDKHNQKYRILEPVRAFAQGQLRNTDDALSVTERLDRWLCEENSLRDLTLVGAQEINDKERTEATVAIADNVLGLQTTNSLAELRIQVKTAGGRIALGTIKGAAKVLPAISAFVNKGISLEDHMNIHLINAVFTFSAGSYEETLRHANQGLEAARKANDYKRMAFAMSGIGITEAFLGKPEAGDHVKQGCETATQSGDAWAIALSTMSQGAYYWQIGDLHAARHYYEEALNGFQALNNAMMSFLALNSLAHLVCREDGPQAAAHLYLKSLTLSRTNARGMAGCVLGATGVAFASRDYPLAAALYGAGLKQYERIGANLIPPIEKDYRTEMEIAKGMIGSDLYAKNYKEGEQMSLAASVEYVKAYYERVCQFQ